MIDIVNVTKTYSNKLILSKINLHITEGQFIIITGNSGAGKSTLLNIIGLLEDFDEGEYLLFEKSVNRYKNKQLANFRSKYFGFIFQLFYLIPNFTVRDNILLPSLYSKDDELNDIVSLAKKLNIDHILYEKVDYLSGGEKQRVAIARALINKPKILICDEPTGNLDKVNTEKVMRILKEQIKTGVTVILVTHDDQLFKYSDDIYLINENGELIENEKGL